MDMKFLMILLAIGILTLCFIFALNYYLDKPNIEKIFDGNNEFNELYKIYCQNKTFYTSYPERLNFYEVCG